MTGCVEWMLLQAPPETPKGRRMPSRLSLRRGRIHLQRQTAVMTEISCLFDLLAEGAALGEACDSARRLAKHDVAIAAENDGLRVGEDGGDLKAPRALDVHEVGVRGLNQALELVAALLLAHVGVEEINIHL